jgi:Flp pilus assembly protein TadG
MRIRRLCLIVENRQGTAAVEFAVCLPAIVLLFLGAIELASMTFLKESLAVASYEGARTAAQYNSETSDVLGKANALLDIRDVEEATVTVSPANVSNTERGDLITVTVSSPCNANALIPLSFLNDQTITVQATMVRE